jgi:succinoglycan biosynthesis transport protein ExoP
MELHNFFRALGRHKLLLVLVPLLTIVATTLIVRSLPDKYPAHARIATGVTDGSQQTLSSGAFEGESKVNQEFNNLIQMMQLKKIVDQVSYQLMLHDLQSQTPFRPLSKEAQELSPAARKQAVAVFTKKYQNMESLSLFNGNENRLNKLLQSMKYDDVSLRKFLNIYRLNNSDFIDLTYDSPNPQLSAFVLNILSSEFINYYTSFSTENKRRSVTVLDSMLQTRRLALASSMDLLRNYKIEHQVLDAGEQAKTLYGQIADISTRRSIAQKDQASYSGALANVNGHLQPANRAYLESDVSGLNQDIVQTKDQIKALTDVYVQSNYKAELKPRIDSLQRKLSAQLYNQSERIAYDPVNTKEALVNQKLSLEVSRDLAQHSVSTLSSELSNLQGQLQQLVPSDAVIHNLESNVAVADKEFTELLQRYNQATMEASYVLPLRLLEKAMPGNAEPGKKMLIVGMSGIASLLLCLAVLFGIFFFDRSVHSPMQLLEYTSLAVLGSLNKMQAGTADLEGIWTEASSDNRGNLFKNLLRSIRFELDSKLRDDEKVIAVTSLTDGAGKTFFTLGLAYAFAKIDKKVLVIDGNFLNPDISRMHASATSLENFLISHEATQVNAAAGHGPRGIDILGNHAGDSSLLELVSEQHLREKFAALRENYDVILIETCSLAQLSKAKEWVLFADKVVAVFESGQSIHEANQPDIEYLRSMNGQFAGMVINKIPDTGLVGDGQGRASYTALLPWSVRVLEGLVTPRKRLNTGKA